MSKPYFAYENLVPAATVTARTESSTYPVGNLTKHRLWPGYRSADQCLVLNGVDEYAYVADHADFDITGDLTIEALVSFDSLPSAGQWVVAKRAVVNTGYLFKTDSLVGNKMEVEVGGVTDAYLRTTTFSFLTNTWYRIKLVYNSGTTEISIYVNGVEIARANNSSQTGCTLTGTIPSAMGVNSNSLLIGTGAGAGRVNGRINYSAIAASAQDHGGYLKPSSCVGYWEFDGNLSDSSGHGHTLTSVGIDSSNYQNCTAYQWISFLYDSKPWSSVFIDRRHNLSEGATVRLYGNSLPHIVGPTSLRDEVTVAAGTPILLSTNETSHAAWLEIHDPDNPDGYIEIPYIYFGSKVELDRGFLRGYRHSDRRHGSMIADSAGGLTAYVRSEELWEADFRLRALPGDLATVRSLASVASLGRPFVFSEDGSAARTRLVYWPDALTPAYIHNVGDQNFVDLPLREAGGGL